MAPSLPALRRERAHRDAILRRSRLLLPLCFAYVVARALRTQPGPGLHGAALGISLALGGLAVGATGLIVTYQAPVRVRQAFLAVMFISSAALVWLQSAGPAIFGMLASVAVAARLVRGVRGAALVGAAIVFLGVAHEFSGAHRNGSPILLAWLGVVAVYTAVSAARRAREGDDQLLVELERTRDAQVREAALAERQRLAREMHDVLAHSLSGLALQLEVARLLATESPADPRLGQAIDRAHHLARTGLEEARRTIGTLRGDELPGPDDWRSW